MAALRTRKEARDRLTQLFQQSLDRIIPPDDATPLRGQTFRDFEDQADEVRKTLLPAVLEERASLESTAQVAQAGHCPHCSSGRTYLVDKTPLQTEIVSPHGPVIVHRQRARCRQCSRSFFPSASGIGTAGRNAVDAQGGRTSESGDRRAAV